MGHYYDSDTIVHLRPYSPAELRMERAKLAYELLELMMVDLSHDAPDDLAVLLAHSHDLARALYRKARAGLVRGEWIEEEDDAC